MSKVIRDGMVAVLYSPGFGAGWSTWNTGHPRHDESVFDPDIVAMVEAGTASTIIAEFAEIKYGGDEYFCVLGVGELSIEWIPEGAAFRIKEYDGSESVELQGDVGWMIA